MSSAPTPTAHRFPRLAGHGEQAAAGYAAGYAAGLRAAGDRARLQADEDRERSAAEREEARARIASALRALDLAAQELREHAERAIAASDARLAAAAVEVAALIIGDPAQAPEQMASAAVARVLGHEASDELIAVHLNPADLACIGEIVDEPGAPLFVADPNLDRGEALGRLDDGVIDARLSSAIERCRAVAAAGGAS